MRVLVSYPGNFMDAQQAARAFHERGSLAAFVTGFAFDEESPLGRLVSRLPKDLRRRAHSELRRRQITEVPSAMVVSYPWPEVLRTALSRYIANPVFADMAWDAQSGRFDRAVGERHLAGIEAVHAFEYTAEYTFGAAARLGVARVLGMPSIDSKEFEAIRTAEEARFPELRSRRHGYFAKRFARRYGRRRREIALADVIVANSEVTRQSHIRAGADPGKIVTVPLAAPPPLAALPEPMIASGRPLSVVWAGSFSVRKGAHYFLDAWRALGAGAAVRAAVFGSIGLPERVLRPLPEGIELKGSVPRAELLAAFERADVLVFPTLADGFGMVVTEAFSRGLPVITTARAGASDLVEHERNGLLIPPSDAAALADALRWCLGNRRALCEMRRHALDTARRWQWSDYRALLVNRVTEGLRRAGYDASFGPSDGGGEASRCPESLASAS